jgi:hypothetical protein
MLVTLSGIVTLVRELQLKNAEDPMLVTLLGILTLASELQPSNAEFPMLVTLSGIATLVSEPGHIINTLPSLDSSNPFFDE